MDVVALAAAGIEEAVAPLGTALTEHQIERLWRQVPCPILCFDGDAAGQRAARRAIDRALPLLKPGHSLAIVTLPAKMDPDDVVRQGGAAAMDTLLAGAIPLIEALWQFERDAAPLNTPEDKAGLKQRLIDLTATIAHPDIRALYRRELLDRFGALAYPARASAPPRAARGPWKRAETDPPLDAPHLAALRRIGEVDHTLRPLLRAVIIGLIANPAAIARHADMLCRIGAGEEGAVIDHLLALADSPAGAPLDSATIVTRLQSAGLAAPGPDDLSGMPYQAIARGDAALLAESIAILVELPQVEQALAQANMAAQAALTDASFAEQQRLVQRRLALRGRLGQMGRARAAL